MGGTAAHRRIAALALSLAAPALALSACGKGGKPQDRKEPRGDFPVRVISVDWPLEQRLAKDSTLRIVVENPGPKTIPNINVTVKCGKGVGGSFTTATSDVDVADPQRPQFIVNRIPTRDPRVNPPLDPAPLERSTSFVDTYPLGPLAPRVEEEFVWDVTAVKAGPYKLCWKVNAGLYGKAVATKADGSLPISGIFQGEVSDVAPEARVGDDGRTVIEEPPEAGE